MTEKPKLPDQIRQLIRLKNDSSRELQASVSWINLIQMGLAQREVDVLHQRTADGMEAKLRAGGWAAYLLPDELVGRLTTNFD